MSPDSSVVEHFHGKEGVSGSNPDQGSMSRSRGPMFESVRKHYNDVYTLPETAPPEQKQTLERW